MGTFNSFCYLRKTIRGKVTECFKKPGLAFYAKSSTTASTFVFSATAYLRPRMKDVLLAISSSNREYGNFINILLSKIGSQSMVDTPMFEKNYLVFKSPDRHNFQSINNLTLIHIEGWNFKPGIILSGKLTSEKVFKVRGFVEKQLIVYLLKHVVPINDIYQTYLHVEYYLNVTVRQENLFFLTQGNVTDLFDILVTDHRLKIYQLPYRSRSVVYTKCYLNFSLELDYSYCLNITVTGSILNYVYIRANTIKPILNTNEERVSWNEAEETCRSVGSYLPILKNKESIEELVSVIRSNDNILLIHGLFIGLKTVNVSGFHLYLYFCSHFVLWYRSGPVNSKTVNPKFHLNQTFYSNFHLIQTSFSVITTIQNCLILTVVHFSH